MRAFLLSLTALLALSACASPQPKVIQSKSGSEEIHLTVGMAAQVEMPQDYRAQSVVVGNPSLVGAEQMGETVNLVPKGGAGETNLIIRAKEKDGASKVFQYHLVVDER